MIELVMVVCLTAVPAQCHEERPMLAVQSVAACATQGQILAARWISEHPAFTLSRWRCEVNRPREERI